MIDAIGQIDAVIEQHLKEIDRLNTARSVLLELTANPNRVKNAVIEKQNRGQGITIRRLGAPPVVSHDPAAATKGAVRPKSGAGPKTSPGGGNGSVKAKSNAAKSGQVAANHNPDTKAENTLLGNRILKALLQGPLDSPALGPLLGYGPGEDRQRMYQRLYDLRVNGFLERLPGKLYQITPKGSERLTETAKELAEQDAT
jgi:hypothetical protein